MVEVKRTLDGYRITKKGSKDVVVIGECMGMQHTEYRFFVELNDNVKKKNGRMLMTKKNALEFGKNLLK